MNQPLLAALVASVLAIPATLDAQRRTNPRAGRDVPELGVARISALDGDVRVLRTNGDETRAQAGTALFPRDALLTGPDSRAEVQLDFGNFIRLSGGTEVRFVSLGRRSFRMSLLRGVANVSQMKRAEADVSVETPLAAVAPLKPGRYTIESRPGGTDVTVRDGKVEVFSDGRSRIVKNDTLSIRGEGTDVDAVRERDADPRSDFEEWAKRRDKVLKPNRGRGFWAYPPFGGWWSPWRTGFACGWGFRQPFYPLQARQSRFEKAVAA